MLNIPDVDRLSRLVRSAVLTLICAIVSYTVADRNTMWNHWDLANSIVFWVSVFCCVLSTVGSFLEWYSYIKELHRLGKRKIDGIIASISPN
jgi:hypothetical protein